MLCTPVLMTINLSAPKKKNNLRTTEINETEEMDEEWDSLTTLN